MLSNFTIFTDLQFCCAFQFISLFKETPKQFLNPTQTPKIAHQGPKKSKTIQKLSQNQKSNQKDYKDKNEIDGKQKRFHNESYQLIWVI